MFRQIKNVLAKHIGFTLMEVMIAAGVLGIGCLGVLGMLTTAQGSSTEAKDRTQAVVLAEMITAVMETESRQVTSFTGTTGVTNKQPVLKHLQLGPTGEWFVYNRVSVLGDPAVAGADDTEVDPAKMKRYCVGMFKRGNDAIVSGAVRVYWHSNGRRMSESECSNATMKIVDKPNSEYKIVTLPFSFTFGTTSRESEAG